jgi:putative membrane protein
VSIAALTEPEATDLISRLRPTQPTVSDDVAEEHEGKLAAPSQVKPGTGPRWTLSGTELAIVAATSSGGILALAALGPVAGALVPLVLGSSDIELGGMGSVVIWFIAIAVVLVALVSWVAGSVATALQYWEFAVVRSDGEVRVEKGLFQRNSRVVPLGRVQAVRLVEGPLRQMIGRVTVAVDSAGIATGAEFGPTVLHPMLTLPDARRFCDLMVSGHELPRLQPLPARARIRYLVRLAALPTVIALMVALLVPYGSLAFLVPLALAIWALAIHADAAWGVNRDVLAIRWRGLARTTALVRRARIQSVSVTQHPLQRLAGLASVSVSVAASPTPAVFSVMHLDQADAWRMLEWVSNGAPDNL